MKIVMLKDVGGVGKRGAVIEVSDGYALNLLIPQGKAEQATPKKIEEVQRREASEAEAAAVKNERIAAKLRELDGKSVTIQAKANAQGHLFKKLSKDDVADSLAQLVGYISPDMITGFSGNIKDAGEHAIHLIGAGVESTVTLVVEAA